MQTTVQNNMTTGLEGQLADLVNNDKITRSNYSKQLDKVTISADDTTTTVTINGTAFTFTETGASELKAYIADYLTTAINAGAEPVTAYYTATNDYFLVESDVVGTAMTVVGTASCVVTNLIGNAAAIGFGLFVTDDNEDPNALPYKARVPIAATDITTVGKGLGFTIHTHNVEQSYPYSTSVGGTGYALESAMNILRRGHIYLRPETAVTPGQQVYVRFVAAGTERLGAVRNDADTADAALLPTAYFRTACAAGGIALVEINLP